MHALTIAQNKLNFVDVILFEMKMLAQYSFVNC